MNARDELFSDAQVFAIRFPETFTAPSLRELAAIRPGDMVQLCIAKRTRCWIEVTGRDGDTLVGIVADLLEGENHGIQLDANIVFELRHVYQITYGYLGRLPEGGCYDRIV